LLTNVLPDAQLSFPNMHARAQVSDFVHSMGHDVFIFSMPLKGVNLGPGSNATHIESDHWWFLQWEQQGDHPLRYYIEPVVLTANFAEAAGYEEVRACCR
jgi:hypothetical protein